MKERNHGKNPCSAIYEANAVISDWENGAKNLLLQLTLAYFLMLIVMTFNTWLCLAVVVGSTTGYFLFGWRKSVVVDAHADHCH